MNLAGGVGSRYFADDEAVAGSNPARRAISGSSVVRAPWQSFEIGQYADECRFCNRLFPGQELWCNRVLALMKLALAGGVDIGSIDGLRVRVPSRVTGSCSSMAEQSRYRFFPRSN